MYKDKVCLFVSFSSFSFSIVLREKKLTKGQCSINSEQTFFSMTVKSPGIQGERMPGVGRGGQWECWVGLGVGSDHGCNVAHGEGCHPNKNGGKQKQVQFREVA